MAQIEFNILASDASPPYINTTDALHEYYANLDLLLVVFIGKVDGRAWGSGDEHLMLMDIRFAGPSAMFGAPEAAIALIHVGGLQQPTRLIVSGRAAEHMLNAAEVSAPEIVRVGLFNSAYASTEDLRAHVDRIATKIAMFHVVTIRATKVSIARQAPSRHLLEADLRSFDELASFLFVAENVKAILQGSKNQSELFERDNPDNVAKLLYRTPPWCDSIGSSSDASLHSVVRTISETWKDEKIICSPVRKRPHRATAQDDEPAQDRPRRSISHLLSTITLSQTSWSPLIFTFEYSNGYELADADGLINMKQLLELGGVKMNSAAGAEYKKRTVDKDFGEALIKRGQGMSCSFHVAIATKRSAFYMEVDADYCLASEAGVLRELIFVKVLHNHEEVRQGRLHCPGDHRLWPMASLKELQKHSESFHPEDDFEVCVCMTLLGPLDKKARKQHLDNCINWIEFHSLVSRFP